MCQYCLFRAPINKNYTYASLCKFADENLLCRNCRMKLRCNIVKFCRRYSYYRTGKYGKCSSCAQYVSFCENMLCYDCVIQRYIKRSIRQHDKTISNYKKKLINEINKNIQLPKTLLNIIGMYI